MIPARGSDEVGTLIIPDLGLGWRVESDSFEGEEAVVSVVVAGADGTLQFVGE